jgi:hypothetical protein
MANEIQKAGVVATVSVAGEVNGVEMGVLDDGTSYFSMRGLSRVCGVSNANLSVVSSDWLAGKRDSKLAQFLVAAGVDEPSLYAPTKQGAKDVYAFGERISGLVLEYYACEAKVPSALANYRVINRAGLRIFVYTALGYDPQNLVPQPWREFHARLLLVTSPAGYFSVFKESADFVLYSIQGGLKVDAHTVPDISIGTTWGDHWKKNNFDDQFGKRIRHEHNFPDSYPQARSNPQEIWVYPVAALGAFRIWLQTTYIPLKFPNYLGSQVAKKAITASAAELLLEQAQIAAALPPSSTAAAQLEAPSR